MGEAPDSSEPARCEAHHMTSTQANITPTIHRFHASAADLATLGAALESDGAVIIEELLSPIRGRPRQ